MSDNRPPVIYPAHRAIEHAVSAPGVQPRRYFGVLWPLWQVEITGTVDDPQAYEVLDRFIERAINEAGLDNAPEIAAFLGLPESLVEGCLRYLGLIDHIQSYQGALALTPRGQASLLAGKRYVAKEARQLLLFDQFTLCPLLRSHYAGSVVIVNRPILERTETADGTPFTALFAGTEYRDELVHRLATDPNRTDYNLPRELGDIQVLGSTQAYLPAYLVETTDGLLAYSRVSEQRDTFLESACRDNPQIGEQLAREQTEDPQTMWIEWAAERRAGLQSLQRLPNGVWRCTLPATEYGDRPKVPLRRLGSFEVRKQCFLQLWCDDRALRQRAVLDRAARMARSRGVESRAALTARASALAAQLDVPPVEFTAIRQYAERAGLPEAAARLDQLM